MVNFSVASNRRYKDSSNQWQDDVCYIGIVACNRLVESCKDRLKKGSAVVIDGELQSSSWTTDEGHTRSIVEIKARRIQFLNKRVFVNNEEPEMAAVEDNNRTNTLVVSENGNDGSIKETKSVDYNEDSFDKFLSSEESDLIKED